MDRCEINYPYMVKTEGFNVILFAYLSEAKEEYGEKIQKYPNKRSSLLKMNYIKNGGVWFPQHEIIVSHVPSVKKSPKIEQLNAAGEVIAVHDNTTDARISIGHPNTKGIGAAIRKGCMCGGYYWRHKKC